MADRLTTEELKKLLQESTPGPWSVRPAVCQDHRETSADVHGKDGGFVADCGCHERSTADATLAAAAPSLAAELLSLRERERWIPVTEKLPEQGWWQTHERMTSGSIRTRFFLPTIGKFVEPRTENGGDVDVTYFVTHWRELPSPPSETEKETTKGTK